jgi:hypothetical protein
MLNRKKKRIFNDSVLGKLLEFTLNDKKIKHDNNSK